MVAGLVVQVKIICVGLIEARSKTMNFPGKDLGLFFIHIQVQLCQVPGPTLIKFYHTTNNK